MSHQERLERARLALEGLSIGDAFGERFFVSPQTALGLIEKRAIPKAPWRHTDDTQMALGIYEVLERHQHVERDELALVFARRYAADPHRGYGGTAHRILQAIAFGEPWQVVASIPFNGAGSMGNGAAMRVAPLGAYFAEDGLERVCREAVASAEVTHAHPEGQAGAVAVAVAAAWAWLNRADLNAESTAALFETVLRHTPEGHTKKGIVAASELSLDQAVAHAAELLGSGSRVISEDTVPFSLWCAARHLTSFEDAMWSTVSGLGDRDTTCAIVGGIVALAVGRGGIPEEWLEAREPLELDE